MGSTNPLGIQFFIDFDGTVTTKDVIDLILERFADVAWKEIEKQWASGAIGSRECLSRQLALVKAEKKDIENLLGEVQVDSHFLSFVSRADELAIPLTIVSDGMDLVIRSILSRELGEARAGSFPVFSNRLEWVGTKPLAYFPSGMVCCHGCANCKVQVIEKWQKEGIKNIFIGDGMSDRFAAKHSDLVFAKSKLLAFCKEQSIECISYKNFGDIVEWVNTLVVASSPGSNRI